MRTPVKLARSLAQEAAAVASAMRIALPFNDPWSYVRSIAEQTAGLRNSMLADLTAGVPTENDHINGAVVAAGRRAAIPTPYNEAMFRLIRAAWPFPPPAEEFHETHPDRPARRRVVRARRHPRAPHPRAERPTKSTLFCPRPAAVRFLGTHEMAALGVLEKLVERARRHQRHARYSSCFKTTRRAPAVVGAAHERPRSLNTSR